jgi:imidazolonepropionase-like amidohydrolase
MPNKAFVSLWRTPPGPIGGSHGHVGLAGFLVLLLLGVFPACEPVEPGSYTALVGGRVIDGTGTSPYEGWTVLIRDSVIEAVGPDARIPRSAERIDVSGHTVLPGLIDMHGHMYAMGGNQFDAYPTLFLAGGVTTVFSPGDFDPEGMIELRDQVARGEVLGPRILTAGPYFDAQPSLVGWIEGVTDPEEAVAKLAEWEDRIDAAKVYSSLEEEEMAAVIEAAHTSRLKVTGHLGGPVETRRAIELGIDGLEHGIFAVSELTGVSQAAPLEELYCALASVDLDGEVAQGLIQAILENHVWVTPTTVTMQGIHPDFDPPVEDWGVYLSDDLRHVMEQQQPYLNEAGSECLDRALAIQMEFVKRIHTAGGLVVTGTDPVSPKLTPGYALHAEMANLVEGGLTPLDAIRAATRNGAVALGLQGEIGTIEAGKRADLIVVMGDPSLEIEDVGNTIWVFKGGLKHDPAHLRKAVRGAIGLPAS